MWGEMTPRERLLAAMNRQEIDRPAVMPNMIRWIRGRYGCTSELQQLQACEEFGFDPMIVYGMYLNVPLANDYVYRPDAPDAYRDLPDVNVDVRTENYSDRTIHIRRFETPAGVLTDRIVWARPGVGYGDGPNPVRDEPLVKSMTDVEALKHLYPPPIPGRIRDLVLFTETVGERGVVEYLDGPNAGTWGMESLGAEKMLLCAVENKELLHAVIRVCQDQHLRTLKAALEAGHKHFVGSWFQCSASVGWSPADIEEFFLPMIKEEVALVKSYDAYYRYQDDGKMMEQIPHLVELGVDIVGGLQPPPIGDCDFGEVKRKWGDRICLYGGLDPVYTFERGTPDTVRTEIEKLLAAAGDGRGIIIGVAEAFGPETPAESLHALAQAVREGWKKRG